MAEATVTCMYDPNHTGPESVFYRQVVGLERVRWQGGANAITDRQTTGKFVCLACVDKIRRGIPVGQDGLFV